MQNDETTSSKVASAVPVPCRHIRCKEMYHQDPGQPDDEFSSGIYWCVRTQDNLGPDGQSCGKCECSPERACYQE